MRAGLLGPVVLAPRAPPPAATAVGAQLLGLAVLGGVVAFHEAGHFSAAALLKIRVDEFALGFGPALVQKRFKPAEEGGVNYVVRALPLGGYVSFPRVAEDEEDPARKPPPRATRSSAAVVPARPAIDPADPSLFENKPFIQQAVVVCAGIVFNLILSWSCIFGGAAVVGLPPPQPVSITRVLPGTPAEAAGFQIGDKLISVNQRTVDDFSDPLRGALGSIRSAITSQTPFTATVERSGQPVALLVSPPAVSSVLGVQLAAEAAPSTARAPLPPLRAASRATQTLIEQVTGVSRSLLPALAGALGGGSEGAGLQGPLAISATAGRIAEKNPALLLDFAALISINLAVFNALPIPGLDGFQLLLLGVEALRGEKIDRKARNAIDSSAGFLFLYLVSNVLISDAGLGRISPGSFLLTLAVTQLGFAGAEAVVARLEGEGGTAEKAATGKGRGGSKTGDKEGRGSNFFGKRIQAGRGANADTPTRGGRSRKSNASGGGDENVLRRLTRRLANNTRSSVQGQGRASDKSRRGGDGRGTTRR